MSLTPEQEQEFEFRLRFEQEQEQEAAAAAAAAAPTPKKQVDPNEYLYKPVAGGVGVLGAELLGPGITQGFENVRKGRMQDAAGKTPKAPTASGTQFNARGVTPQASAANWEAYNDLQQQAADRANRTTAMKKKFPNYQRPGAGQALSGNPAVAPAADVAKGSQFGKDAGRFLKGMGSRSYMPFVGRALAGGSAGVQGADAWNRAKQEDYTGAVISGLGSIGSAATLVPHPWVRGIGTAVSVAAPMINDYRDKVKSRDIRHENFSNENTDPMGSGFAAGGLIQGYANLGSVKKVGEAVAKKLFDPRFDKRVLEQEKLANQILHTERTGVTDFPSIHLPDYEGRRVITSMSDRTPSGTRLLGINDVKFNRPVELNSGQEYMYNNPGQGWASGKQPVNAIMKAAEEAKKATGKDPLYMPWRMAPTSSDFAHSTGETMLVHAQSNMGSSQKKDLDKLVKNFIPNWAGVDNPASMEQFMAAPANVRKSIQNAIDRDLRGSGALGLGETRLAIADPKQLNAPEGGLMHVGEIHADKPIIEQSGSVTYPKGVPGAGLGQLDREHIVTEFLTDLAKERGIADVKNPSAQDLRALQMKPYTFDVTDKLLKAVGYAAGGAIKGYAGGDVVKGIKAGLGFFKPAAKSHSQDAKVAQALEEYLKGNISQEERMAIMNKQLPLRPWTTLPPAYTDEQVVEALMKNKRPKALAPVPEGMRVGNRLDIPAYLQNGVYIDTTHAASGSKSPISYNRTGHLKDVAFESSPDQAVRVGLGTREQALTPLGAEIGKGKSPFAKIEGVNVGTKDEEVRRMMQEYLNDPEWAQIGMDPRRHSQFYDKATGMPVWSAEEKLQSGPLILVPKRGLETTTWDDPRLNLSDFQGKKYAEGGHTTPAWQRSEGKNPEGGLNAVGRASYNRETGGNLKAPQPEGGPRKKSFCARMEGMKKKNTSSKTANDPDSRINKSLRKWKC